MFCPKCGNPDVNGSECPKCGIIISKFISVQDKKSNPDFIIDTSKPEPKRIHKTENKKKGRICPFCHTQMFPGADTCPSCGKTSVGINGVVGFFALVIALIILWAFVTYVSKGSYKTNTLSNKSARQISQSKPLNTIEKLIPADSYATLNADVHLDYQIQQGKYVKGGLLVECTGVVPFDLSRNQIEMVLLKSLKDVKKRYPSCEWIIIWLLPDARLKNYCFHSGHAEYKEGNIVLNLAAPSPEQITNYNSNCSNLGQRIAVLDKSRFDRAVSLMIEFKKLDSELRKNQRIVVKDGQRPTVENYHSDEDILKILSRNQGYDYNEATNLYHSLYVIYDHLSWGSKQIKLDSTGQRQVSIRG